MNALILGKVRSHQLRSFLNGLITEMSDENPISFYNHGAQAKAARLYKEASKVAAMESLGALSGHLSDQAITVEILAEKKDRREVLPRRIHKALCQSASNIRAELQETTCGETEKIAETLAPIAHAGFPQSICEPAQIAFGIISGARQNNTPLRLETKNLCLRYAQESAFHLHERVGSYFSE